MGNQSLVGRCFEELSCFACTRTADEFNRMRRAYAMGLALPETLLSVSSREQFDNCGQVEPDERSFARLLHRVSPQVITIARSVDGYMPFHCAERLEAAVLKVLRRTLNRTFDVTYDQGVASISALRA